MEIKTIKLLQTCRRTLNTLFKLLARVITSEVELVNNVHKQVTN